jgi:hypothetical protein
MHQINKLIAMRDQLREAIADAADQSNLNPKQEWLTAYLRSAAEQLDFDDPDSAAGHDYLAEAKAEAERLAL